MNSKGYVYTLVSVILLIILMSLTFFYLEVSRMGVTSMTRSIMTDELYYFVESVKDDFRRSAEISGKKASTYAIDYVITHNKSLAGYTAVNCTPEYNYSGAGPEAALIELMYCGTLYGQAGGSARYMENNTLRDWVNRTVKKGGELKFNVELRVRNLSVSPYDSFRYAVLGEFDLTVTDPLNQSTYEGQHIPLVSFVSISGLEDPLYYLQTTNPALVRAFRECSESGTANYSIIDSWIASECYHSSGINHLGPSFFDRLEGNLNLTGKYVDQSRELALKLKVPQKDIGLESIINLDLFLQYNQTVNSNNTWVDYFYWQNVPGNCTIKGSAYSNLRLDHVDVKTSHILKYNVVGSRCGHGVSVCDTDYTCGPSDGVCPAQFGQPCREVVDPDCGGVVINGVAYNCGGISDGVCPQDFSGVLAPSIKCEVQDLDCA